MSEQPHDNIAVAALLADPEPATTSLKQWMDFYLALEVAACASPHTQRAKTRDMLSFLDAFEGPALEGMPGRGAGDWIRPLTIAYVHRYDRQPATAKRRLATLRTFARFIQRYRQTTFPLGDPTEGIAWPKLPQPEWKGLSEDELRRLRAGALDRVLIARGRVRVKAGARHRHAVRDLALFEVLLGTALRVAELCSLDRAQFDGTHFRTVRRKGGRFQDIRVPSRAREALVEWLTERGDDPGALFLTRSRSRMERSAVTRALKAIARQAGPPLIDVHPHLLRHTALRALSRRASIEAAIRLSGHSSACGARYVVQYTSADQEELERAQEEVLG